MIFFGVGSLLPPPIWNTENEHGWQVVHCPSAAAIFIGWDLGSLMPGRPPKNRASMVAGISPTMASLADRWNIPGLEWRRRCQADTASMTAAPAPSEAASTWRQAQRNTMLVRTAQMSVSWARSPAALSWYPTGRCIQELAAMMNAADRTPPRAT